MKKRIVFVLVICLVFSLSCKKDKQQELLVIHAGSLAVPFKHMADEFMKQYPDITVQRESAGSRTCARKITELNSPADVMASADSAVIQTLLIPQYADYCIDFTTNEMVIMHTKRSRYSDVINADNWSEVLLRDDVWYGHSDPNADPCGYRTMLCWKLAEMHYEKPGLFDELVKGCPEKNIRPKEVDLLALLESGELDYIFIYRSVAEQHRGELILLPDEINLKSSEMTDLYKQVSVELTGKKPGETIVRTGAPMVYGITVPKTAAHPELGVKFVSFVLSEKGQKIMEQNGQPEIIPLRVDHFEKLQKELKSFFRKK
ncbi:MAG: tungstate ABC transporter substrate-binding protein WtpA [Candidatus Aminicenantes bacterium]|nr:tungstate ABC transporter substrate-binding protein WtpA [Candidatus Aminicenantes bacterium]